MPTPIVASIKLLRNAAAFLNLPPPAEGVEFLRFNLVYGFNGSGKTTISRLFEAARSGGERTNLPDKCECTFELSDGTKVALSDDPSSTAIGSKLAVFNEDFVERSLTWKSGSVLPIVYIGEEQGELAEKIATAETAAEKMRAEDTLRATEWSTSNKALGVLKTDLARLIANELSLGRNYTATHLKSDYDGRSFPSTERLADDKLIELKETVNRTDIGGEIDLVPFPDDYDRLYDLVTECLSMTVENVTIASLERRPDALPWVKAGITLHQGEADCIFCSQTLPPTRLDELREALGEGFKRLTDSVEAATIAVEKSIERLRSFRESLPATFPDALPAFRSELETTAQQGRTLATSLEAVFEKWKAQLELKAGHSNEVVLVELDSSEPSGAAITETQSAISDLLARHNGEIARYSEVKAQAKDALKAHHLAGSQTAYSEAIADEAAKSLAAQEAAERNRRAGAEILALKAALKEHAPAARELNELLHSYLGHQDISLKITVDGYNICRGDRVATKPLSEGEKTAIAFCYFLINLKSEGRKIEDLIVVIDDPISSLDTRSMTFVFALIKSRLEAAAQLFILTHNIDFMRENKKMVE